MLLGPPRWMLLATGCALLVVALIGAVLGFTLVPGKPLWFLLGFEVATAVAAGALAGMAMRGLGRDGPALALFTIGGSVMIAALLGYVSLTHNVRSGGLKMPLMGLFGVHGLLGVWVLAMSAGSVLLRRPGESLPRLIRGIAWGVGLFAFVGAVFTFRGPLLGLSGFVVAALAIVGFAITTALLSLTVHHLVRAFEVARGEEGGGAKTTACAEQAV